VRWRRALTAFFWFIADDMASFVLVYASASDGGPHGSLEASPRL
jgi:hypothetical protein